jgi:hypothetical protein
MEPVVHLGSGCTIKPSSAYGPLTYGSSLPASPEAAASERKKHNCGQACLMGSAHQN